MPQYMLLLHEDPKVFADVSPSEMQAIIEKYRAWSTKIATSGNLLGGDKLKDGCGRTLRGANGKVAMTDGPYAEVKEVIGGYFKITADNYDHAVTLASECPHVEFGVVEVREIDPM